MCVFAFFATIQKFKMAAILGERKFFLKIGNSMLFGYPMGRKFQCNFLKYLLFIKTSSETQGRSPNKQFVCYIKKCPNKQFVCYIKKCRVIHDITIKCMAIYRVYDLTIISLPKI